MVTSFETAYRGGEGGLKKRYNAVLAQGARIIAGSDFLAAHVSRTYDVEPGRLRVVRQGIDLDAYDPERMRGHRLTRLHERWSLGLERRIVLLPGRVVAGRGHLAMLEAMRRLSRDDFVLLILGDLDTTDPYVRELESGVRDAGLVERVHFAGACDDLPAAYALADVVVMPATADGTDIDATPAIEAQAMGKPVILGDVGALGEAVLPAATGWLVQPGDTAELAWSLERALAMEQPTRERLAERARGFVMREYSIEQSARRTIAVYRELVRNAPRPNVPEPVVERLAIPQVG